MIESVMLTENDVVDCVVSYLKSKEFTIDSMCNTMQKGIDIVANKNGKKILVEAKGATTSKEKEKYFQEIKSIVIYQELYLKHYK